MELNKAIGILAVAASKDNSGIQASLKKYGLEIELGRHSVDLILKTDTYDKNATGYYISTSGRWLDATESLELGELLIFAGRIAKELEKAGLGYVD